MSARRVFEMVFVSALLLVPRAWAEPSSPTARGEQGTARSGCDAFVPQDARYSRGAPATLVSVRITPEGEMRDPALYRSSGDSELDRAALACANGFRIGFVSVGGKPAEVRWILAHNWAARGSGFGPALPPGAQNPACKSGFRPQRIPNPATTVSYRIATDGSVTGAAIAESSGVLPLDQAIVRCVASWRFFPVTQNGQPVEAGQSLQVNWGTIED